MKILLLMFFLTFVGCSQQEPLTEYIPLVWSDKSGSIIESPSLLDKVHANNLELVLKFYKIHYQRSGETKIFISKDVDRETLWNFTSKANDKSWLNTHTVE